MEGRSEKRNASGCLELQNQVAIMHLGERKDVHIFPHQNILCLSKDKAYLHSTRLILSLFPL